MYWGNRNYPKHIKLKKCNLEMRCPQKLVKVLIFILYNCILKTPKSQQLNIMNITYPIFWGSGIQCGLVRSFGSGSFTGCNLGVSPGCGHSSQGSTRKICFLTHTLWLFLALLRSAFKIIQINIFQFEILRVVSVSTIKYN